jgi:phage repressor protein C with HTH and peptisase S24 domain
MSSKKSHDVKKILERFKQALNIYTDSSLAEYLGIKPNTISTWRARNTIDFELLFSKCEDININWLLTGEGEPYISGNLGSEYALVPVIEGYISAGAGLYPVEHSEIKLAFRKDWISRYGDYKKMSLIYVKGDSMEPTIYDGDIVLVNHNVTHISKNGAIYAIVIDNLIMIKRLQKIGNNKVLVISDNQKYPAYETKESELNINGQVIWFGHEIERNPEKPPEEKET